MVWNCQCPGRRVHLLSWSVAPPTGFVLPCCLLLPLAPLREMSGSYAVSLFLLGFHPNLQPLSNLFSFFLAYFENILVQFLCLLIIWHETMRSSLCSMSPPEPLLLFCPVANLLGGMGRQVSLRGGESRGWWKIVYSGMTLSLKYI